VAQVVLKSPSVAPVIGQLVAADVAEHGMDIRCGAQISEALWGTERLKFQAERLNPLRAAGHVAYHRGRADLPYLHIAYKFLNSS
jgi:hypothetical protein